MAPGPSAFAASSFCARVSVRKRYPGKSRGCAPISFSLTATRPRRIHLMPAQKTPKWQDDFDQPWKGLNEYFPQESITLTFPEVATEFDWSVPPINRSTCNANSTPWNLRRNAAASWIRCWNYAHSRAIPKPSSTIRKSTTGRWDSSPEANECWTFWMPLYRKRRQPIVPLLLFSHTGLPREVSPPIPGEPKTLRKYGVKAAGAGMDFSYHAEWVKNILERCGDDFFQAKPSQPPFSSSRISKPWKRRKTSTFAPKKR